MKIKPKGASVFKDKRVQIGIAAAAVLGLIALVRRGNSGDTTVGDAGGQSLNTGTLDSTGTDSYNAISQIGQAWQDTWNSAFQDFSSQLGDINDTLGQIKPPVTTNPPPSAIKVLPINNKLPSGRGFYIIKRGDTAASIAQRSGISLAMLNALNPGGKLSHLGVGEAVRIRAVAGPAPTRSGRTLWR